MTLTLTDATGTVEMDVDEQGEGDDGGYDKKSACIQRVSYHWWR